MENSYEKFTNLILNISRYIQKIKKEEMANYGLKGKQVQCIFALYNSKEGLNAAKLSKICQEDKGALSRTVKELTDADYIYVDETSDKKYKNPIKLTKKGLEIANNIAKKINEMITLGSMGLDNKLREGMYNSLTQISNNLAMICKNYKCKAE